MIEERWLIYIVEVDDKCERYMWRMGREKRMWMRFWMIDRGLAHFMAMVLVFNFALVFSVWPFISHP